MSLFSEGRLILSFRYFIFGFDFSLNQDVLIKEPFRLKLTKLLQVSLYQNAEYWFSVGTLEKFWRNSTLKTNSKYRTVWEKSKVRNLIYKSFNSTNVLSLVDRQFLKMISHLLFSNWYLVCVCLSCKMFVEIDILCSWYELLSASSNV